MIIIIYIVYILGLCFSSDSKILISCSYDKSVRVWDVENGIQINGDTFMHDDYVWDVCISPDDKYIVSGSNDKFIKIWDIKSMKQIKGNGEMLK